jgi:hypothetical protein
MLDDALRYIALGWFIFPCHTATPDGGCSCEKGRRRKDPDYHCDSPGKHPRITGGLNAASTDPEQIREWWELWPDANIGLNCGKSGLLVVDRDNYKDFYKGDDLDLDENTVTAISGGGGGHLFYAQEPSDTFGNSNKNLPAGIDIRGHGGYVVLAPSLHKSGNRYQWELDYSPWDIDPAPLPPKLRALLEANKAPAPPLHSFDTTIKYNGNGASQYGLRALENECVRIATAVDGTRNETLNTSAFSIGQLVAGGEIHHDLAWSRMIDAAMDAGLSQAEAERTAGSGLDAGMESPRSSKPSDEPDINETMALMDCPDPALLRMNTEEYIEQLVQNTIDSKSHGKADFDVMRTLFAAIATIEDKYLRIHLRETVPAKIGITKTVYNEFLLDAQQVLIDQATAPPEDKPDTWPYLIHDDIIQVMVKNKDNYDRVPVAMFQARITAQHIGEDGGIWYTVTGKALRGSAFSFVIDADSFSNNQKLKAAVEMAAGPHDPVMARMEMHLGAAIKMLSPEPVKTIHRYDRTGWAGKVFLIPGMEPEETEINLSRKMPYRIDNKADLALGIECLDSLIKSMDAGIGPIVASFMLQPPMALHAGWRDERYGLFIRGRTGSQKSSTIQVALCLYGPDFIRDDMLIKWGEGATRNAIMGYATTNHDLPFLIDNFKPNTGGGTADFVNLMHNIVEGGEKERMNRAAQLRETKPVYTWPIFTGEDTPDTDAASLARLLAVTFEKKDTTYYLSEAQRLAPHLCAVGKAWITWLQTDDSKAIIKAEVTKMQELRDGWVAKLLYIQPSMANPHRVATNLATNQIAWTVLEQHPILGKLAAKYKAAHLQGLAQLAKAMSGYTTESGEGQRLIELLRGLLASGRIILLHDKKSPAEMVDPVDRDRVVGWEVDGAVYILPEMLLASVKRFTGETLNNISRQALYEQLDALGFIAGKGGSGVTKPMRLGGKVQKVLHLKPTVVNIDDENETGL